MGFMKALRKVGKVGGALVRSPLGKLASAVPGVGTVLGAAGAAAAGYQLLGGGGGSSAPPGGLPALPGMGNVIAPGQTGGFGLPRGPGGGLQLPWNDPSIPEYLKQFALDDSFLRTGVRAPRGYVVIRDAQGRPFAVLKKMAQVFKLWKPKPKPPISVRDWNSLKRSGRVVDKMKDMEKTAKKIANWKSPARKCAPTKGRK